MSDPKRGHPFNINQQVVVTLNDRSIPIIARAYPWWPPKQPGDRVAMQLWDAMKVFGPEIVFGGPPPLETTIELLGDPWGSREAIEARMAGHESYRIEFVGDFLEVPPGRRAACLRDFADSLATFGPVDELARGGESAVAGHESTMGYWLWVDDSRRDITAEVGREAGRNEKPL